MKKFFIILIIIILIVPLTIAQNLLSGPESVAYDQVHDRYLVSNFTNGTIVEIDSEGNQNYFATGFGHCLGNVIYDSALYFSRGTIIVGLDLETGTSVLNLPISGSNQLDGMTVDNEGYLYVADYHYTGDDKIFKINLATEEYSEFVNSGLSSGLQDLIFDEANSRLIGVAYFQNVPIQAISLSDSSVSDIVMPSVFGWDGITRDSEGNYYLSTWDDNSVYRFDNDFTDPPEQFSTGHNGPAGLDYNPVDNLIAVPCFNTNTLDLVDIPSTSVNQSSVNYIPRNIVLSACPNPFNPGTILNYNIIEPGIILLTVFDVFGSQISTIFKGYNQVGKFSCKFDASGLPNGIYFVMLKTNQQTATQKIVLLK